MHCQFCDMTRFPKKVHQNLQTHLVIRKNCVEVMNEDMSVLHFSSSILNRVHRGRPHAAMSDIFGRFLLHFELSANLVHGRGNTLQQR